MTELDLAEEIDTHQGRLRESVAGDILTSTLREYDQRLSDLEAAKSDFLRLGSHELRSPLAVIQGYVSMSLAGDFGPVEGDLAKALTIAHEHCRVMSTLIDQMLDTALIGEHALTLQRTVGDLRDIVRRAADAAAETPPPSSARVRLSLGEIPVLIDADPEQLAKAICALVDNALKYSAPESEVLCEVAPDAERAQAYVVVTADDSHIHGGGLGLFLAREIARLHGGEVRLDGTVPGLGSTFVLTLPLAVAA